VCITRELVRIHRQFNGGGEFRNLQTWYEGNADRFCYIDLNFQLVLRSHTKKYKRCLAIAIEDMNYILQVLSKGAHVKCEQVLDLIVYESRFLQYEV
jgi:hypothetical protein